MAFHKDIDLETYFPIVCHGDDADSHRRRSFCCFTIASPLSPSRSSWDTRVLLYIVDTSRALPETYDVLDSWVVLGLCELQEGKWMNVDIYGRPWDRGKSGRICGKYTGVWVALKGDQKFLQRALKLNTSATSDQVCMYCRATSSGQMVYTAFGPSAPHRSTLVTNDFFFHSGCRPNSWLRLPGFDVQRVLADWLHLIDLSLIPETSASVTWLVLGRFQFDKRRSVHVPVFCWGFIRIPRPLLNSHRMTAYGRVKAEMNACAWHLFSLLLNVNGTV